MSAEDLKDFFEFRGLLDNDYWNHLLFSEILKYVLPNRDFKIIHANKEFKKNTFVGNDRSKLKNIRSVISHLINFMLVIQFQNLMIMVNGLLLIIRVNQ